MGVGRIILTTIFVTLPSVVYSITLAVLFPIGYLLSLGRSKASAIKIAYILNPIISVIILPLLFYFYISHLLSFIFAGWMLLYFVLRRLIGVSKTNIMQINALRGLESLKRETEDK